VRDALRTTIACTAAALLAQTFHLDQPFWAIITILVLAPPTAAASLRKAATRLAGTAAGCLLGVAWTALFGQQPPLQIAAIFVTLAAGLYFASGTIYPYSFFVASFTTAIVTYSAVQAPELAGEVAWARFTEISLGVLVSGSSHLLLWPVHADQELRRSLSEKIERALANLDPVYRRLRGETVTPPPADPTPEQRLSAQLDLLDTASGLHESIYRRRYAWEAVIGLVEAMRLASFECGRLAAMPAAGRGLIELAEDAEASLVDLRRRGRAMAIAVVDDHAAARQDHPPLDRLDATFTQARRSGSIARWSSAEVSAAAATIEAMRTLSYLLSRLEPTIDAACGRRDDVTRLDLPSSVLPPFLPLDGDRLRNAVKGSLAATIAIVLGASLHWTLGTPSTATCIVLAVTTSIGSFVQKSGLRLLGAFVGGAMALGVLAWIMPNVEGPAAFTLIAAVGILPCAWLLAGGDRVNYLGMQMAYAFSIGVLGPLRPTVDLWTPTSRVLGVIVGIIIVGTVFTLLWPSYATRQFRRTLAATIRVVREVLADAFVDQASAPFVSFPRQRRLYDSLAAATRLLGEAEYEDPGAIDLDRARAHELLSTVRLLSRSVILWRQARRALGGPMPDCETTAALAPLGQALVDRLATMARVVEAGTVLDAAPVLAAAVDALDEAIGRDRAAKRFAEWPTPVVDGLFACVEHARDITRLLDGSLDATRAISIAPRGSLAYAAAAS